MKHVHASLFAVCLMMFLGGSRRMAQADDWDKMTKMTFKVPVDLPGVTLVPGTYVFRLADGATNDHVVQVSNENQTRICATILAVPDYRLVPDGKTVVTFEERVKGAPEAIKAWFFPGDNYGVEFIYPKPSVIVPSPLHTASISSGHESSQNAKN